MYLKACSKFGPVLYQDRSRKYLNLLRLVDVNMFCEQVWQLCEHMQCEGSDALPMILNQL